MQQGRASVCATFCFFLALAPTELAAQTLGQGVESVAVDDGLRRICVNASTDEISVRLERIVVAKSKSWFREDTAVDVLIDGKLAKRDERYLVSHAKMPIVFRANIDEYEKGTVVTPVQISLLSRYPLIFQGSTTTLLEIDFSFVNASKPSVLTKVISKLPDAARGLPIPPSPYTEGFIQATSVLNGLLDTVLQDEDEQDNVTREGRISLEFNNTGRCGRNGAYSGMYVFLKSLPNMNAEGIIRLNEIPNYCFIKFNNMSPIFIERKTSDDSCTYERTKAVRLLNPHFTLMLGITSTSHADSSDREVLESGMALKFAEASQEPQQVAQVDQSALDKAFDMAGWGAAPSNIESDFMQLAQGNISYAPNAAFREVSASNQTVPYAFGEIPNTPLAQDQVAAKMVANEILLNSIARCATHGLDIYECF